MAGLTDKQKVFVEEYLTCWNATEAARRANYGSPEKQGWQQLGKARIREAIKARLAEKAMPADEVLARLAEHARGDIRPFLRFDAAGQWVGLDITPDKPLHLIKKIKPTRYGTEIELHDPQAALVHLAKHHGLLTEVDFTKLADVILQLLAQGLEIDDLKRLAKQSA